MGEKIGLTEVGVVVRGGPFRVSMERLNVLAFCFEIKILKARVFRFLY